MTRARDIADQQDNLGGAVPPFVGAKNFLVNGGMDFNQRGGAAVSATNAYCLDRWYVSGFGSGANNSFGQIGTGDSAANFKNYLRYGQGAGTASTNFFLSQSLETINVIPLQGKVVTFSFWYRTATAFTSTWQAQIVTSTSTDQNINNLYIGASVTVATAVIPNSTTWRYASVSGTVPSNATSLAVGFVRTGNVVANATFDLTGAQLEIGSAATPFARAGGSIGGELALCQRYYQRITGITSNTTYISTGVAISTTRAFLPYSAPVTLRTTPSVAHSSGKVGNGVISNQSLTSISAYSNGSYQQITLDSNVGSGLTTSGAFMLVLDQNAYVELSAEL